MADLRWMIYGAYGYSGTLIAEEAVRRGHHPVLAGRSEASVAALAERLGLEHRAFGLDREDQIEEGIGDLDLVLHAAGPFVRTWEPMFRVCLRSGLHYMDISAEATVLESMFSRSHEAEGVGIALMPAVGFAVVASDCAARMVAEKLPGATELETAVVNTGGVSRGTLRTAIAHMPSGILVRRDGVLQSRPVGKGLKPIRFWDRVRMGLPIPWGDLVTAHRTTGIANITTYLGVARGLAALARWAGGLGWIALRPGPVRWLLQAAAGIAVVGPDAQARQKARAYVWARARRPAGEVAEVWLETAEAYRFTALAAVRSVERILGAGLRGALTPGGAFGGNFVLEIPGTKRHDRLDAE